MSKHIIDALRPELPEVDPRWDETTMRAILDGPTGSAGSPRRARRRRLWDVVLAAAAVAAIIGGIVLARHALPRDDVRPAEPKETVVQSIDPANATKLELGDSLEVVEDLPATFDGDTVHYSGFAGSDAVVGSIKPDIIDSRGGPSTVVQEHPILYDLRSRTFTLLDDRARARPSWVSDVHGTEDSVVWVEGVTYNIGESTFAIYSYDRRSHEVTQLAEYDDPDGQIVYANDLDVSGATAYFSTLALPAKKGQNAVYAVPVDGSTPPRVLAAGGASVRFDGEVIT